MCQMLFLNTLHNAHAAGTTYTAVKEEMFLLKRVTFLGANCCLFEESIWSHTVI